MLNRRSLRIKAMQAVYAYTQARTSNYQLALDLIAEQFQPDLNSMILPDFQRLEGLKKLATLVFEERIAGIQSEEIVPKQALEVALIAQNDYNDRIRKDRKIYQQQMLESVDTLYNLYLKALLWVVEIANEAERAEEQKATETHSHVFAQNAIVRVLKEFPLLKTEATRYHVYWDDVQRLEIRRLFRETIRFDEKFEAYCQKSTHTPDEERLIVWHLIKNIAFEHELMRPYFEQVAIGWDDDQEVLESLVKRTLKSWQEGSLTLQELSANWEDDRQFFKGLVAFTLDNEPAYEKRIVDQLKNWDADRIALTDRIILLLAVAELVHCSGIPVKVTVNEYIEIAKWYSTPKSGQFVNGVLDVLSKNLIADGTVKKAGRGLQ